MQHFSRNAYPGFRSDAKRRTFPFPDELRSAYSREWDFFFSQLTDITPPVVVNLLSDPKIRKGRASHRIWHATAYPKTFCTGISRVRLCGWLAATQEENIRKYAKFLTELEGDQFSPESVRNAKKLIVAEAKFRRIWIDFSRSDLIPAPTVKNTPFTVFTEEIVEKIWARAMEAVQVTRKVDILTKRLSRQCARIMDEDCRLVVTDADGIDTIELSRLLEDFVYGHVYSGSVWKGVRISFPHVPNKKYKDGGWAYFIALVRLLRENKKWQETLFSLLGELAFIRMREPFNTEARSLAQSFVRAIRIELTGKGGGLFGNRPIASPCEPDDQIREALSEPVSEPQIQDAVPIDPISSSLREFPAIVYKKQEPVASSLPQTAFHPNGRKGKHADIIGDIVRLTENGKNPVPVGDISRELQEALAWTFFAHGVDMDEGGELIHTRTGIRLALDKSGDTTTVWGWTSASDRHGVPTVSPYVF